ncbi:MAG: aromatic ring-hydroxylating dioxygenase subunit alpha [Alphaproteobacteria bacterium]
MSIASDPDTARTDRSSDQWHALGAGAFDADPKHSRALPARFYTEPEIFEQERQKIFRCTWQYVGHVSQVLASGDYFTCQVAGENLIVIRAQDGELRAFYNVCRHRCHHLLEGAGTIKKFIVCPYHAWTYAPDGRLVNAPNAENVSGFDVSQVRLAPVRLEISCNFVFINLDSEARPLTEQADGLDTDIRRLTPDLNELTFSHRLTFDIASNWKNVEDNFLESYHVPVAGDAHRNFIDLIDYETWKIEIHGIWQTQHAQARPESSAAYDISEADVLDHGMWWLWPNILILRYPGNGNLMVWNQAPVAVDRTLQTFDFYFLQETPNESQREVIRYLDQDLQPEDVAILESVQRGQQSSSFDQGYYMTDYGHDNLSEHGVHHFHCLLLDALSN